MTLSEWLNSDYREFGGRPDSWRHWFDYDHTIWLVYLAFWFIEPYLEHEPPIKWLWLSLALALFVPLYFLAHHAPRKSPMDLGSRDVGRGYGLCADESVGMRSLHLCSNRNPRNF